MTAMIEKTVFLPETKTTQLQENSLSLELMKDLLQSWRAEIKAWKQESEQFQKLLRLGRGFQQDLARKKAFQSRQKELVEEEFSPLVHSIGKLEEQMQLGMLQELTHRQWQRLRDKFSAVKERFTGMRLEILQELTNSYPLQLH